jgi:hypothetical protein
VLVVLFVRRIAIYLEKHDLAVDAERLLGLLIAIIFLNVAFVLGRFVPILGWAAMPILAILAGIGQLVLVWRYFHLLRVLRLAIEGFY